VVLFATVLGVLVQGLPRRELLLEPLEQLRLLFRRMNKLVARSAPIGILGLTASTLASLSPDLLLRSQALLMLNLVALVLLAVLGFTAIVVLTPLDLAASWRILRGPLAITASSANLLIALPLLNDSLSEEMARFVPDADPTRRQKAMDEISALMPVGFALPNLGQVVSLLFLPFAAWFVDRPLDPSAILTMLATGIPAVTGGIKSAVRMELQQLGLPANLIGLVQLNGEWLYRQEKVLSLLGLAVLVILVVCSSLGVLRFRPAPLLRGGAMLFLLAVGLGGGGRALLARNLASSYHNDQLLLTRRSTVPSVALQVVSCRSLIPAPINMDGLQARNVLRVGLRGDQPPWVFRNRAGQLIGYVAAGTPQQLAAALEVIRAEIDLMRATLDPVVGQQRAALDLARLQLDWLGKRVDLAALQGQLRQAEINLERTLALHKTQMATDAQLDAARITRESLVGQSKALTDLIAETEPGLKPVFSAVGTATTAGGLAAAIRHKEKEIAQLEAQLGPQPVLAPIDGTVTAILRRSGEAVAAAEPIVLLTSPRTDRIVGFIRQPVAVEPKAGMSVEVRTRTFRRQAGVSAIGQVGNQLEPIPATLLAAMRLPVSVTPTEFGLRVVVPTPPGLPVRPGEQVDLIVRD